MLAILTLCLCCYFDIDSMAELTKKAVGVLPFGKYIWDFYQVRTGTYENHIGSLSFTTLEFSKSLLKFVLTGYIYHFVVRKFVEFVLFDPIYNEEYVSKTYRISTKIKAEFFYNVGFALAALLAGLALEAFGRLPFFQAVTLDELSPRSFTTAVGVVCLALHIALKLSKNIFLTSL